MDIINEEELQEIEADLETIASDSAPAQKVKYRQRTRVDDYCDSIIKRSNNLIRLVEAVKEDQFDLDSGDCFGKAMKTARAAERLAIAARQLPCVSGTAKASAATEMMIAEAIDAEIGYTEEGWFSVRLPMLLPKKEKATREYLNGLIYPVLHNFFRSGCFRSPKFYECVLIYRHVYAYDRPERLYRDHDNIEVNQITDALAMYVMRDDGPALCSHYHCMARAPKDRTEVYVIPQKDFVKWLSMEPEFPEEGVNLLDLPENLVGKYM